MTEFINAQSPIFKRRVAFVGKLGTMNRREARELVRNHGGEIRVDSQLGEGTTVVVRLPRRRSYR